MIDHDFNVFGEIGFNSYIDNIKMNYPLLYNKLDEKRIFSDEIINYYQSLNKISWEFENKSKGGRGNNYTIAQKTCDVRSIGINKLINYFKDSSEISPNNTDRYVILDILGGPGTINRCLSKKDSVLIINSDISDYMCNYTYTEGIPTIRESSDRLLFKDNILDGVLIAYGTHHIKKELLLTSMEEAFRVLKNKRKIVIHDFEHGSSTDKWFKNVVNKYSSTGHPHDHFSSDDFYSLLKTAGFKKIVVERIDDPFVIIDKSYESAMFRMLHYVIKMYDLYEFIDDNNVVKDELLVLLKENFNGPSIVKEGNLFRITLNRTALVGIGEKSY